jgi:hypothetical protein
MVEAPTTMSRSTARTRGGPDSVALSEDEDHRPQPSSDLITLLPVGATDGSDVRGCTRPRMRVVSARPGRQTSVYGRRTVQLAHRLYDLGPWSRLHTDDQAIERDKVAAGGYPFDLDALTDWIHVEYRPHRQGRGSNCSTTRASAYSPSGNWRATFSNAHHEPAGR